MALDKKDKKHFLRYVPIFGDLNEEGLIKIANLGIVKKFRKGEVILLEEEAGSAMFVIISGKVKIVRADEKGREVILSILSENDFFGEMAILDGSTRSASVVSLSSSEVFIIHRKDFLDLMHDHPQVAVSLLKELTARLRKADSQIKSLSLKDASGKVAFVILQLADEIGLIQKGCVVINELPLQQDLANMAGTSRETVSRMIHKFVKKGLLKLQGSKLIINDYEKFQNLYL